MVARLVGAAARPAGDWEDAGHPLAHHAEGPHLRPDRRDRGRPHDLAARAPRRRAELGLPLLLAPRRHVHPVRAHDRRLHGRGARVAGVAPPRRGRAPRRTPRSCTGLPASGCLPEWSCPGSRATRAPRRCGSATPRAPSSSSTSTARSWTCSTARGGAASSRTTTPGASSGRWSSTSSPSGRSPTRGSGRSGGRAAHFTHSRVMAWVAVDRAVKAIEKFGLEGPGERWRELRADPRGRLPRGIRRRG